MSQLPVEVFRALGDKDQNNIIRVVMDFGTASLPEILAALDQDYSYHSVDWQRALRDIKVLLDAELLQFVKRGKARLYIVNAETMLKAADALREFAT